MTEVAYSNRELDAKFTNVEDLMSAHFDAQAVVLRDIKAQTTKTNGRVTNHDKMLWTALGALPLLAIWAGILTNQFLSAQSKMSPSQEASITAAVDAALQKYDINP